MQGRMSDTDKVLLLLCGIKHKISARQDYYVSFMRYRGGGEELLHCFEISETTGKAFIVKRLVIVTFCYRIFRYHWSLTHIFATLTTTR